MVLTGWPDGDGGAGVRGETHGRAVAIARNARHPDFGDRPVMDVALPHGHEVPVVAAVPHAGRDYPAAFRASSRLDPVRIRRSEDAFVDELFGGLPALGIAMLRARFPRAWLDVNREPYELDPRMFDGPLPSHANTRSVRVAGGLGTVPRLVAEGQDIYRSRLPVREGLERIERVYKPYHEALRHLMTATHGAHGLAVLLDCHSMPSAMREGENGRPDVVVGDRFGTAASRRISEAAVAALRARGFAVARNKPYAGGFTTEHYGRPARGLHVLQIELNRALYMNETSHERGPGFAALRAELTAFVEDFLARTTLGGGALMAAE